MEMTMPRASLSLAVVLLVLCTVDSIGGNYLAFPRMGRSRRLPRVFVFPRKRQQGTELYTLPDQDEPSPEYRQLSSSLSQSHSVQSMPSTEDKRKLPWNFIFPRKRGHFPGKFIAPRKRSNSGYLAFPRMGRSFNKVNDVSDCCGVGLKTEFLIGQGKDEVRLICSASSAVCCDGLKEMVAEKPDGVGYSMCIPDVDAKSASSSQVINKLKHLLQK